MFSDLGLDFMLLHDMLRQRIQLRSQVSQGLSDPFVLLPLPLALLVLLPLRHARHQPVQLADDVAWHSDRPREPPLLFTSAHTGPAGVAAAAVAVVLVGDEGKLILLQVSSAAPASSAQSVSIRINTGNENCLLGAITRTNMTSL